MASKVVEFRSPWEAPRGPKRLAAIRAYRAGCAEIAAAAVTQAFKASTKVTGTENIGIKDAYPLFIAAMRRELRKSGLF